MADKKENNKPLLPTKPPRGNYQIWVILATIAVIFGVMYINNSSDLKEVNQFEFEQMVKDWPIVRECWTLSGDIDFIMKCVATNLSSFQELVSELTSLPNVRNVRTALTWLLAHEPVEAVRLAGARRRVPDVPVVLAGLLGRPAPAARGLTRRAKPPSTAVAGAPTVVTMRLL